MSLQLQQPISKLEYPHIVDVSTDPESKQTYVKMFLINDDINKNFWQVPINVMKKYATSFIGRPWIVHPSGDHPDYIKEGVAHNSKTLIEDILQVQDRYKGGDIIDVSYEPIKENPEKKAFFATVRITNPSILDKLKQGAISSYVSPQIYDLSKAEEGQPTTEFIPLHIATVEKPAYGHIARIKGICNGSGPTCINALKSAAVELVNMIDKGIMTDNNSSFLKNLGNNTNRTTLTNPPYFNPQEQVIAENGYNPNTPRYVDQNGQLISQRTQVQEVDQSGNIITRTEDKKPRAGTTISKNPSQIIATPQSTQGQTIPVTPQPQTQPLETDVIPPNPNTTTAAAPNQVIPNEVLEVLKNLQATQTGINQRLDQIENFKKSTEDEKLKRASEAQRAMIESVFTPEIIEDEAAREDIINKFVSLPLSDEDLAWVLDLILTGKFSTSGNGGVAEEVAEASIAAQNKINNKQSTVRKNKGTVKQASLNLNRLVMQNPVNTYQPNTITLSKRFFGDVDVDNL
jgi:hypothetical protein